MEPDPIPESESEHTCKNRRGAVFEIITLNTASPKTFSILCSNLIGLLTPFISTADNSDYTAK